MWKNISGLSDELLEAGFEIELDDNETGVVVSNSGNAENLEGAITIPDTVGGKPVTGIANSAFKGSGITSVDLPDTITSIGNSAFADCENLTTIDLPESLKVIDSYAFSGCTSLESIEIPDGVTTINSNAFIDCSELETVDIPDTVTEISDNAFKRSGLTSISIPSSVDQISGSAFEDCTSLTIVTIADGFDGAIISNAFAGCTALTTLDLGGTTEIGNNILTDVNLESLVIPSTCREIASSAFNGASIGTLTIKGSDITLGTDILTGISNEIKFSSIQNPGIGNTPEGFNEYWMYEFISSRTPSIRRPAEDVTISWSDDISWKNASPQNMDSFDDEYVLRVRDNDSEAPVITMDDYDSDSWMLWLAISYISSSSTADESEFTFNIELSDGKEIIVKLSGEDIPQSSSGSSSSFADLFEISYSYDNEEGPVDNPVYWYCGRDIGGWFSTAMEPILLVYNDGSIKIVHNEQEIGTINIGKDVTAKTITLKKLTEDWVSYDVVAPAVIYSAPAN